MLAASEIPDISTIDYPVMVSYKYDGIRCLITDEGPMSRKSIKIPNRFVQEWVCDYLESLIGFDGELIVGQPNVSSTFTASQSAVNSVKGEPDFKLYVFELWNTNLNAWGRYQQLQSRLVSMPDEVRSRIVLVKQEIISEKNTIPHVYKLAIHYGYEGLILKNPRGMYKHGRSTLKEGLALKYKEFIDINCKILSVKQRLTNTNPKEQDNLGHAKRSSAKAGKIPVESLGGFEVICTEPESPYYNLTFGVGPGCLTSEECDALWREKDTLVGKIIKVKAQHAGSKDLPRFPVFMRWLDGVF